jgi:HSP20 family protein
MNLIRYNPASVFDTAFGRIFDDLWNWPAVETTDAKPEFFAPRVEVRDNKDAIHLTAELPGVDKDGISVQLENGVLTLSGEKKQESEVKENGFYRSERRYGQFKRSFTLPDVVDPNKIDAEFRNGVLKLTLSKKPEAAPKQISVRGDAADVKKIGVN